MKVATLQCQLKYKLYLFCDNYSAVILFTILDKEQLKLNVEALQKTLDLSDLSS